MFHRLQLEEWHSILRTIGFELFLVIFLLMLLRTIFMPRKKVDHAASLPLENEEVKDTYAHGK